MTSKKVTCQNVFDSVKKSPKLLSQLLVEFDNANDEISIILDQLEKRNIIFSLILSPKQKIILSEYAKDIPMTIENKIYVYTPNRFSLISLLNRINKGIEDIYGSNLSPLIAKIDSVMGRIESFSRVLNPEMNMFHYSALIKTMLLTNSLDLFKDFDVEYGIPATKLQRIISERILMKLPLDFTLYPAELENFDYDYNQFIVNLLLFFNKMYKLLIPSEIFGREIIGDDLDNYISAEVFDIDMNSDLESFGIENKTSLKKSKNKSSIKKKKNLSGKKGISHHKDNKKGPVRNVKKKTSKSVKKKSVRSKKK